MPRNIISSIAPLLKPYYDIAFSSSCTTKTWPYARGEVGQFSEWISLCNENPESRLVGRDLFSTDLPGRTVHKLHHHPACQSCTTSTPCTFYYQIGKRVTLPLIHLLLFLIDSPLRLFNIMNTFRASLLLLLPTLNDP